MFHRYKLDESASLAHYKYFVFDKDDTITPASKPIEKSMANNLIKLMQTGVVIILTARNMDICQEQILHPIQEFISKKVFDLIAQNLIISPSNWSEIFTFHQEKNNYQLRSELSGNIPEKTFFEGMIPEIAPILWVDAEKISFEIRSKTMGAFSCIPRNSNDKERKNFDPDKSKRKKAAAYISEKISPIASNIEVLAAGSTSIDISLHDKGSGMRHIMEYLKNSEENLGEFHPQKLVFFGDGFDGGNDTPIASIEEITVVQVKNKENTREILESHYHS